MNRAKTTIDDMEATAKDASDGTSVKQIRDECLVVYWDDATDFYNYRWGKNRVTRELAISVLASA